MESLETFLQYLETSTGERIFDYSEKSRIYAFIIPIDMKRIGIVLF
jgi:hypothetical protein